MCHSRSQIFRRYLQTEICLLPWQMKVLCKPPRAKSNQWSYPTVKPTKPTMVSQQDTRNRGNSGTFFLSWALGSSCLMGPKTHSVSFKNCWYYIHGWCCIPSQLPMAREITDHRGDSPSVIFLS